MQGLRRNLMSVGIIVMERTIIESKFPIIESARIIIESDCSISLSAQIIIEST